MTFSLRRLHGDGDALGGMRYVIYFFQEALTEVGFRAINENRGGRIQACCAESMMINYHTHRATRFTLVELLVVSAIIGILASMLLPAFVHAKMQAKYVVCMNQLDQLGLGVMAYADDFDSWYPYRSTNHNAPISQPFCISDQWGAYDDRPLFTPYMDLDSWFCPFTPLNPGTSVATSTERSVYVAYEMWFGGMIERGDSGSAMYRVGDRAEHDGERYEVLVADLERESTWVYIAAHPDRPSLMEYAHVIVANAFAARYYSPIPTRGKLTRNFLFQDGSVHRISSMDTGDERVKRVRFDPQPTTNDYWGRLPAVQ